MIGSTAKKIQAEFTPDIMIASTCRDLSHIQVVLTKTLCACSRRRVRVPGSFKNLTKVSNLCACRALLDLTVASSLLVSD